MSAADRADFVVVGAGIAGLTAAVRAAEAGCSVVILNRSENDIPWALKTPRGAIQNASPKHSITTAVIA